SLPINSPWHPEKIGFFIGFASSFHLILLSVVSIGSFQGAAWVPATKLTGKWYNDRSYAKMFSILGCGSTVAGLLMPFVEYSYWRMLLKYFGLFTLAFCAYFYYTLARRRYHATTSEEQGLLTVLVIAHLFTCDLECSCSVPIFHGVLSNVLKVRTVCETWIPLYMAENGLSLATFQVTYEIGGILGNLLSGWLLGSAVSTHEFRFSTASCRRLEQRSAASGGGL
ncbi:hypothetical protein COOONC_20026, partial [Cooperia oncophora]